MSQQPFTGIKVVEFGQFVAVPVAAQLLADGGAEVIKIEALAGDSMRFIRATGPGDDSKHFICRNHGKQCLPLDLKNSRARPVIDALLEYADIVLLNLRPGHAESVGIAPEQLIKRFPKLIIGSVSGFGTAGPEAGDAGLDLVVQARSGLMAANGRVIDGRPAAIDSAATVDTMAAMTLAFGIAAAIVRRDRTGIGGIVTTSLMQTAMNMSSSLLCRAVDREAEEHEQLLEKLAIKRAEGASFEEQLDASRPAERKVQKHISHIYYTTHATRDSFVAVACGSNPLRQKLCNALGIVDEAILPGFTGDYEQHYVSLLPEFRKVFATQTSDHWVAHLRKAEVPVSKVVLPIELFDDEQVNANNLFYSFEHHTNGKIMMLGSPLRLDEDGFHPGRPTGIFGSDSEVILSRIGFSESEINDLMSAGISHKGL